MVLPRDHAVKFRYDRGMLDEVLQQNITNPKPFKNYVERREGMDGERERERERVGWRKSRRFLPRLQRVVQLQTT
jgi:Zn-finger nucleic acid-binding protein